MELVFGNVLFVAAHEFGHALVSEMTLPMLGREEVAADLFAILVLAVVEHVAGFA